MICNPINKTIIKIPASDNAKKYSAIFSSHFSLDWFLLFIEKNEKKHEITKPNATAVENSSMLLDSEWFVTWKDVITKRQNPKRFADVFKICCDVLFAIGFLIPDFNMLILFYTEY